MNADGGVWENSSAWREVTRTIPLLKVRTIRQPAQEKVGTIVGIMGTAHFFLQESFRRKYDQDSCWAPGLNRMA